MDELLLQEEKRRIEADCNLYDREMIARLEAWSPGHCLNGEEFAGSKQSRHTIRGSQDIQQRRYPEKLTAESRRVEVSKCACVYDGSPSSARHSLYHGIHIYRRTKSPSQRNPPSHATTGNHQQFWVSRRKSLVAMGSPAWTLCSSLSSCMLYQLAHLPYAPRDAE